MINSVGCKLLGYIPPDEVSSVFTQKPGKCPLIGTNWFDQFIPKEKVTEFKARFEQLLKIEPWENMVYENTILTRDGEERLISWNHSTMINSEGRVIGVLKTGKDITEENKRKKELEERERMFSTLFESAADSVIIINNKGIIVSVNKAASKVFGYEKGELLGLSIEMLIPQHLRGRHENHRDKYGKDPQTRSMGANKNLYALNKEGKEFPVEISLSSYTNGEETLVMASINDITLRKAEQEKLESDKIELEKRVEQRTYDLYKSQQLHETVARNFPNGVIMVLDEDFNYVFVEGKEMYKKGIISKDLLGTSFLKRINPNAVAEIKLFLKEVFDGGSGSLETRSNNNVHLLNAVGIDNGDEKIKQILVVSTNITKIKKAEEDILRLLKNEQDLGKLKSRFVSMASHEFRTPLTSIMNSTNLLSKYVDKADSQEKQKNNISRIKLSLRHLLSILDDFLSLDRLEQRKITVRETNFIIPDFCKEIIDSFTGIIKNTSLIKYTHTGEENVMTDVSIFKNILTNLISNAIKYSPEWSEIILETSLANDRLKIVVKDNGIGIPKSEQKNLFDRFFRAENAVNIQGTGLGLNIVKNYLDLLDGRIDFTSEQNKGTVFTVEIPIK
jgi:PAS domain S-box-containing protein